MFLLIAALLALLAAMATLQYRWLGRIGAGEREAMRADLRTKTRGFCEEFDREITRAYSLLKMNADLFRREDRNGEYARRFDRWAQISSRPQIVKGIFLVETGEGGSSGGSGELRLLRFSKTTRAFEPGEWTTELENLRQQFERGRQNSSSASSDIFIGGANSINEEIPALVSAIAAVQKDAENNRQKFDWQHPLGYVVVALDADYIKKEFFPALAKNYFASDDSNGNAPDYNLTIVSRNDPKKIIYQSNSTPSESAENSSAADATDKLLNIGFGKVQTYSSERVFNGADDAPVASQGKPNFTLIVPAVKDSETKDGSSEEEAKVLLLDDSSRWELRANHRLGSLDAAINNSRRWNLALSFGILLLLGASVVLIAVLSRRSQKLARRQIEFVAGVSHEFRTPLAVIYSLSENLAAGRINDAEKIRNYGATIHKDVRRLTEMVEQILQFAGAERNGKHFYDKSPVDAGKTVEKVLAANFAQLKNEGWLVETKIEANLPAVLADEAALERAIQNLIGNAMKYHGENRWLKITVDKNVEKQEVNISVEDKGIGIPPSELRNIFEPFFRGCEAASAQIHGNGIGLSLVKQIVEAHGGRISVNSSLGENGRARGSTFNLYLPVISE